MKATSAKESEVPVGLGWVFEIKWDGMRACLAVDSEAQSLRIWSSNGIDATDRFPELAPLAVHLHAKRAMLDGEIVAFDGTGAPSFELMQTRMHLANRRDAETKAQTTPVTLILFDLLWIDNNDVTSLPFEARRAALEAVVEPGPHWQVSPTTGDGRALLAGATQRGLEGIVAKRLDSPYLSGQRSSLWRKIKLRRHDEFVVGGWHEGTGSRAGRIGGLDIGYYDGDVLRFAGQVGSGLKESDIVRLMRVFAGTATPTNPFGSGEVPRELARVAHWVEPTVVVEVAYAEWTREGRVRHPTYIGQRLDKAPRDVRDPRV